jgi:signal transduction histidine kinase
LTVLGDPQRLQQVFINLLRNATESGEGVTVRVSASTCNTELHTLPEGAEVVGEPNCHLQPEQQAIQILIEDNGRGIPAEELSHVFEPFFSRREEGQGMGLGLYIVQEIIQEHDGCIAISSQPQQGTRIYLRLPCPGGEV